MDKVEFTFKDGSIYRVFSTVSIGIDSVSPIQGPSIASDIMSASLKFFDHYYAASIESRIDFILKTHNKL